MPPLKTKQLLVGGLSLVVIVVSVIALIAHFRGPKEDKAIQEVVGEIMAEQIPALTNDARVVVITLESQEDPVLGLRRAGFERAVKKLPGVKVLDWEKVDTKGKSKYGPGRGLTAERYLRLVKKNPEANVFVSFIGAPSVDKDDEKKEGAPSFPSPAPLLLAEARARENLLQLFDKGVVHAAIVPRFLYPAPAQSGRKPRDKFVLYWQIINPSNVPRDEDLEKD